MDCTIRTSVNRNQGANKTNPNIIKINCLDQLNLLLALLSTIIIGNSPINIDAAAHIIVLALFLVTMYLLITIGLSQFAYNF